MPDMVLCMVSIMVRMFTMVSIIGGNCAIICGISLSSCLMSPTRVFSLSVIWSTPSIASNIDRIDQQIGISKQCFSQ